MKSTAEVISETSNKKRKFICINCSNEYQSSSALSYHKKKCMQSHYSGSSSSSSSSSNSSSSSSSSFIELDYLGYEKEQL